MASAEELDRTAGASESPTPVGPHTLLTGATDGIGRALAQRWVERGRYAFVHGRRAREELELPVPSLLGAAGYLRADLEQPDGARRLAQAFLERVAEEEPGLACLVLNAGTGFVGPLAEQDAASQARLLRVNLLAPMELTRLLLPALRRVRGRVVYVSSVVSTLPAPAYAVYAATKAAAEGFFRSLRVELEGAVEVQVVRPGAARTGLLAKSGADPARLGWERFPDPRSVAARLDAALDQGPRWRTLGTGNRLLYALGRHWPGALERLQARRSR